MENEEYIIMKMHKNEQETRKRRAAAAAVAVALALKAEEDSIHNYPLPPRVTVSAWQAVLRSNIHSTRGNTR